MAVTNEQLPDKIAKPGGGNYFLRALEQKADSDDVKQLQVRKTNKEDSEMIMKSVDILHK